jgi:predicted nucleic acid-binding protein
MIACDTSAMAKFYVPEKESKAIRQLLEQADRVCVSELAQVEIMAVFHRRLRDKHWTRREFLAVVRQFQHDDLAGFWTWLPMDFILKSGLANHANHIVWPSIFENDMIDLFWTEPTSISAVSSARSMTKDSLESGAKRKQSRPSSSRRNEVDSRGSGRRPC